MPIYKAVTVFSTLFAVLGVVFGLILIDRGTDRGMASADEINLWITAFGVGMIVAATIVYAFSTRFTPGERETDKGDSTELSDDG